MRPATEADREALRAFSPLLPPGQEWFTAKEAAAVIGRSDQYVRDCFDSGKLLGHAINGRARKGHERRRSYQIHREHLELYFLETANYESADLVERLGALIARRTPAQRAELMARLEALSERDAARSFWSGPTPGIKPTVKR